jgi:hypothetical protein
MGNTRPNGPKLEIPMTEKEQHYKAAGIYRALPTHRKKELVLKMCAGLETRFIRDFAAVLAL